MFFFPLTSSILLKFPAINDVSVHNQRIAIDRPQKVCNFGGLGVLCSQIHI